MYKVKNNNPDCQTMIVMIVPIKATIIKGTDSTNADTTNSNTRNRSHCGDSVFVTQDQHSALTITEGKKINVNVNHMSK